jgi:uncharacterized protein YegP (UPF0339 family)
MSHFEIVASRLEPQSRLAEEYETRYYWRLRAENGEIVATGEHYTRSEDAERAIETMLAVASDAADEDYEQVGW